MSQHALDLVRSKGKLPARYGNFIGGKWVEPTDGQYFTDYSPINGARLVDVAKSTPQDVEMAQRAGVRAIGVLGPFPTEKRLRAARPEFLLESIEELPGVLQRLRG